MSEAMMIAMPSPMLSPLAKFTLLAPFVAYTIISCAVCAAAENTVDLRYGYAEPHKLTLSESCKRCAGVKLTAIFATISSPAQTSTPATITANISAKPRSVCSAIRLCSVTPPSVVNGFMRKSHTIFHLTTRRCAAIMMYASVRLGGRVK